MCQKSVRYIILYFTYSQCCQPYSTRKCFSFSTPLTSTTFPQTDLQLVKAVERVKEIDVQLSILFFSLTDSSSTS